MDIINRKNNQKSFGLHLTLDLYKCAQDKLADIDYCFKALYELPNLINMHILLPPIITHADSNELDGGTDPGGFSGFVMIKESHISLHTFIKRGFVSIDAYSCKQFDVDFVINYFKNIFKAQDTEIHIVVRGKKYPNHNIY